MLGSSVSLALASKGRDVVVNSSFQNYPHPEDHTRRTTDIPKFKPFTIRIFD